MKKAICILLLALFSGILSAQEEKPVPVDFIVPKHEIGVSLGVFATPVIIPIPFFPDINFDYYYNINSRHAVGTTLSLFLPNPLYFVADPFGMIITPQVNYRISYCQRNANDFYFNLYSLASIGWKISIGSWNDDWLFNVLLPTIHVTFVGMRVGNRRDAAKIEFGWGTQGLIVVGYTHSFIRKKQK